MTKRNGAVRIVNLRILNYLVTVRIYHLIKRFLFVIFTLDSWGYKDNREHLIHQEAEKWRSGLEKDGPKTPAVVV